MKICFKNAFCKFEVGDSVRVTGYEKIREIVDIMLIHYAKTNTCVFWVELDGEEFFEEVKIEHLKEI